MLIFNLQGGVADDGHSFQSIAVGFFIFPQQGFHGFFAARSGMGHYLGMDKASTDLDPALGGHRILGGTEHHLSAAAISHLGYQFSCHFYPPF